MILLVIAVAALLAVSEARPNAISPVNVITVPPNCPTGQVWINGQCREVWNIFQAVTVKPILFPEWMAEEDIENIPLEVFEESLANDVENSRNVITVPPNCPPGQTWLNGACRDVWALNEPVNPKNVVTVPPNCPTGQVWLNGQCRTVWFYLKESKLRAPLEQAENKNIISIPNQCPKGYRPDAHGICREIFY